MKALKIIRIIIALFVFLLGVALLAPLCGQYPSLVILILLIGVNLFTSIGGK